MSVATIQTRDRFEIGTILSFLLGVITRASLFLGLLSIFGQAAQIFRLFDLLVGIYRKIFYWLYGLVLPSHFAAYKKDLITVAIFAVALAIQYGIATYRDLAAQRAKHEGQVGVARKIAQEKREAANSAGGVVGGAVIGGMIDSDSNDDALNAEASARVVEAATRLQFDLALKAAAFGLIRILAFSLALGGVFFVAGRYSGPIEHWLMLYDGWLRGLYDDGLRWAKHALAR